MAKEFEELYTSIGFLFYSVAANDRRVEPAERIELQRIVRNEWLPLESSRDELGTDEGHYVDIAFDYAHDERIPPDEAFERFADHVRREPALFDEGLRSMIFRSAVAIAESVAGRNKAEVRRLLQLEALFQQNPVQLPRGKVASKPDDRR